jgi:hypothetical protein
MEDQAMQPEDKGTKAGKRLHDVNQVSPALRQEAQAHWTATVEFHAACENGRYTGPVFANDEYLAQRVSEKNVVFHRRDQIDFSTNDNLQKRHETNRLNDTNLTIHYEGGSAKAYFHDPQRAAIKEMFGRIKKTAAEKYGEGKAYDSFAKQLGEIKDVMVEKYREAKNRQFEQRTAQAAERAKEPQKRKTTTRER